MSCETKFIQMYNNHDIPVRKIRKELKIEYNDFYRLKNKLEKEGKIKPRKFRNRKKKKPILFYSYCKSCMGFQIRKNDRYYAFVKTEKQAKRFVELMEENNWDYNLRNKIKKQVLKEFPK